MLQVAPHKASTTISVLKLLVLLSAPSTNMTFIVLALFSTSCLCPTLANFQQTALYRDQKRGVISGNFQPDLNHRLTVTKISSSLVGDSLDCTFKCINEPTCYSFNMAANPDPEDLYLCELLDTDKYLAAENDFQVNPAFHHFSPWVS